MANQTNKLNAQDSFAKNIVLAIRSKKIAFNEPQKLLKNKDGVGVRFSSVNEIPGVIVDKVVKKNDKGKEISRYFMTVSFAGKKKDEVIKSLITGKYAGLAYKALTKVPKVRKVEIPEAELKMANAAFGF